MLRKRVIPTLLLMNDSLVKTTKFNKNKFIYVGDPCNTIRIFNELEVDELIFLDISATIKNKKPNFELLKRISGECFMPLCYGGGIKSIEDVKLIFSIGFEKIILNSLLFSNQQLVSEIINAYGSQAVVASIDVKKNLFGKEYVYSNCGTVNTFITPEVWSKKVEGMGVGEIFLTSVEREGTWKGMDFNLIKKISNMVKIPLIAHGGCKEKNELKEIFSKTEVSAVGLGNLVIFQKKNMGVLINFPEKEFLDEIC